MRWGVVETSNDKGDTQVCFSLEALVDLDLKKFWGTSTSLCVDVPEQLLVGCWQRRSVAPKERVG